VSRALDAPLAALVHDLRETGAVTVRTPLGEGPLLAAETTISLGGSVVVKVHPSLTSGDARWQQHLRAVEERLAPLDVLGSWTASVKRIEGALRWVIALVAAVAMLLGAARSAGAVRVAWIVIPPAIALLLRHAVRPLVVRLVTWGLRRALGASPADPPPDV